MCINIFRNTMEGRWVLLQLQWQCCALDMREKCYHLYLRWVWIWSVSSSRLLAIRKIKCVASSTIQFIDWWRTDAFVHFLWALTRNERKHSGPEFVVASLMSFSTPVSITPIASKTVEKTFLNIYEAQPRSTQVGHRKAPYLRHKL